MSCLYQSKYVKSLNALAKYPSIYKIKTQRAQHLAKICSKVLKIYWRVRTILMFKLSTLRVSLKRIWK